MLHYEDAQRGKIILKGHFRIIHRAEFKNIWGTEKEVVDSRRCSQTYVFTVKDERFKLDVLDLEYSQIVRQPTLFGADIYESEQTIPIDLLYPITAAKPEAWKGRLSMLDETTKALDLMRTGLLSYVRLHRVDYDF